MSKILAVDESGNAVRAFPLVPTRHITGPASGKGARTPSTMEFGFPRGWTISRESEGRPLQHRGVQPSEGGAR